MSNPKRRDNEQSLLADLRRRVSWLEQRRTPAGAKKLDDLSDVSVPSPSQLNVLTYSGTQWQALPSVAGDMAMTQAIASDSDDGTFDEGSPFNFQPDFIVNANSYQLVIVTAIVAISDIAVPVTGTGLPGDAVATVPTPWKVFAHDATGDPGATMIYGAMGTSSGTASFPMWLHNDTDADVGHTVYTETSATVSFGPEFDATVTVEARSVFSIAAVTP